MKRNIFLLFSICLFFLSSCYDDFDDKINEASLYDQQSFVYHGLKQFYLYKGYIPELADDFFADAEDLNTYLSNFNSPESLFESLKFQDDRFSIIVPDFRELEKQLDGISLNNGIAFGLVKISSTGKIFGYVRYVMPNSFAENQEVERGMIFHKIDGIELTENNYSQLLAADDYTIHLAKLEGEDLIPLEENIPLSKTEFTENPIHIANIINLDQHKVGYLMYNSFTRTFDEDLNDVFADFKGEGITDLVLDLRYNSGGSIETSRSLAGMITGQFQGELFAKEIYNENFPDKDLLFKNKTRNGSSLNSLNLERVYILTSNSTASASELLINGLNPYINVIQIGDHSVGKFQGSVTLYDSPDFTRSAVKPGHNYAMQPLILKTVNAAGFTDFHDGLSPDILQKENLSDLGVLGNPEENLLQLALENITGISAEEKPTQQESFTDYIQIHENQDNKYLFQQMHTSVNQ